MLNFQVFKITTQSVHSAIRSLQCLKRDIRVAANVPVILILRKRATMHSTNKAFERYFQFEGDDVREIYGDTRLAPAGTRLAPKNGQTRKAKVLKLKE